jgi:hypothetical protein
VNIFGPRYQSSKGIEKRAQTHHTYHRSNQEPRFQWQKSGRNWNQDHHGSSQKQKNPLPGKKQFPWNRQKIATSIHHHSSGDRNKTRREKIQEIKKHPQKFHRNDYATKENESHIINNKTKSSGEPQTDDVEFLDVEWNELEEMEAELYGIQDTP